MGLAAGVLEAAQLSPGLLPCRAGSRKGQVSAPEQSPGSAECELCHQEQGVCAQAHGLRPGVVTSGRGLRQRARGCELPDLPVLFNQS